MDVFKHILSRNTPEALCFSKIVNYFLFNWKGKWYCVIVPMIKQTSGCLIVVYVASNGKQSVSILPYWVPSYHWTNIEMFVLSCVRLLEITNWPPVFLERHREHYSYSSDNERSFIISTSFSLTITILFSTRELDDDLLPIVCFFILFIKKIYFLEFN